LNSIRFSFYKRVEVQAGHFVALIGIEVKQYGQSLIVGSEGGASF
jgi:hypothetical protein